MLTLMAGIMLVIAVMLIGGILAGLVVISPLILLIICLPLIDILVFKLIFRKKKKNKK